MQLHVDFWNACVHLLLAEPLYYNTNTENLIYGQTYIWHLLNQTPNNTPLPPPQNKYLLIIKSSMINMSIHSMICLLEHLGGYFMCFVDVLNFPYFFLH